MTSAFASGGTAPIPADTVAVVLAAGGGTRFRQSAAARDLPVSHKLLAPLRGSTVFECALSNVCEAGFATVLVISGAAALPLARLPQQVEMVHNPRWAEGQATSLGLALDTLASRPHITKVVVGLGDQPFIPAQTWRAVALAAPDARIVIATYDGHRRNPVRIDRSLWDLTPREGDEGARSLFRGNEALITELACQGDPADIDTAEDLLRWS
jgi:molybdenum cofactor cytidylyltransferase